ncbi:MAG: hypothetical protein IT559_04360 [Alphaproteobacteria bacterium]|nr:hypothetical protein [Alphaproteobacteria bacterium]
MDITEGKLSDIFKAGIVRVEKLTDEFGLRVVLAEPENLKGILKTGAMPSGNIKYSNPSLIELCHHAGVIVVGNATMEGIPENAQISYAVDKNKHLKQDFFHQDRVPWNGDDASALAKDYSAMRSVPTIFARIKDVQAALRAIEGSLDLTPRLRSDFNEVVDDAHSFSLERSELRPRLRLAEGYPDLTRLVVEQISPEKLYVHSWMTCASEVVMYSNKLQDGIVHARPASKEDQENILRAYTISY